MPFNESPDVIVSEKRTRLKEVTLKHPCGVCGKDHKCSRGADGVLMCGGKSGPVPGFVDLGPAPRDPQFNLYRRDDDPELYAKRNQRNSLKPAANGHAVRKVAPADPPIDWTAKAKEYAANLTPELRHELALLLGVPDAAVNDMCLVGYSPTDAAWTFPEVDGQGNVVGITRRYRDGRKMALPGSRRGLTITAGWVGKGGVVFCPEGASDVLALAALGLPAVGRPGARAGVEHLAEYLREVPPAWKITIIAENDQKEGGAWPGREGAVATAAEVQQRLPDRHVYWAMPPGGAKDVRAWAAAQGLGTDSPPEEWHAAGARLRAHLEANKQPAQAKEPQSAGDVEEVFLTDLGNSQMLVRLHGHELHYCHPWKKWLVWDGRRWRLDDTGAVPRLAKATIYAMYQDAAAKVEEIGEQLKQLEGK
jgi:hypothetical protein